MPAARTTLHVGGSSALAIFGDLDREIELLAREQLSVGPGILV
jgi:hypothetical protein